MHFFLDTEFNEFGGQLISMGIVPMDITADELYIEFTPPNPWKPWVEEHVKPLLGNQPIALEMAQKKIALYFSGVQYPSIITDHPVDILHFCQTIDLNHGNYIGPNRGWQFTVMPHLNDVKSSMPHHALYDARALRDSFKRRRV